MTTLQASIQVSNEVKRLKWSCSSAVLITAVLACLVSACGSTRVQDLRLLSIDVVDSSAIPAELEGWKPQGRFVRLRLVTRTNVRDIARELELHVGAHAYLCDSKSHELQMLRVVFDHDGAINDSPAPSSRPGGSEIWFFIIEAANARKDINTGELSIPPYDLRQGQHDVCVNIRGRSMTLAGFSSNVVRIDSETMKKALATDK